MRRPIDVARAIQSPRKMRLATLNDTLMDYRAGATWFGDTDGVGVGIFGNCAMTTEALAARLSAAP
jgi:hypothetical protein